MTDIRGGNDSAPLELTGPFTGYNNGATMQVGLWIRNDGEYIEWARRHAQEGTTYLRHVLTSLLHESYRDAQRRGLREDELSLPASVWQAAMRSEGGPDSIDWAQIAYDLLDTDPNEMEIAIAQKDLDEAREEFGLGDDDTAWELAARRRAAAVEKLVLR
jgi:hypothetical protein